MNSFYYNASDSIKILLFSEKGAGNHYHGPGTSAYRLFSSDIQNKFFIDLVHHYYKQERLATFKNQFYLTKPKFKLLRSFLKFSPSMQWMNQNINKYDVFYGLMPYPNYLLPALVAEKSGCPAAIRITAYKAPLVNRSKIDAYFKLPQKRISMLKKVSAVVALSKDIVDELLEYRIKPDKIFYIPNGVNTKVFCPILFQIEKTKMRNRLGLKNMLTIIFVGVVGKHKRPHLIVNTLLKLREQNGINLQLLIIGPPSIHEKNYYSNLKDISRQNRLAVKFITHTNEIENYYKSSDIFCLPSTNEGMPNSLLEAMSSGLPSLTTNISGASELLKNGKNGFFVKPLIEDIAEKILLYSNNDGLRMHHGKNARKTIIDNYSHEIVLNKYHEMFSTIIYNKKLRS